MVPKEHLCVIDQTKSVVRTSSVTKNDAGLETFSLPSLPSLSKPYSLTHLSHKVNGKIHPFKKTCSKETSVQGSLTFS